VDDIQRADLTCSQATVNCGIYFSIHALQQIWNSCIYITLK